MKHIKSIKNHLGAGEVAQAKDALDNLLHIGPNNIEALKLKAAILTAEGNFADSHSTWLRIAEVDRNDEDAVHYFLKQQQEDREHFYFTDEMPDGSHRYLAYPKALISSSAVGLLGCIAFLIIGRLGVRFTWLQTDEVVWAMFLGLVIAPWASIVFFYLKALRDIRISEQGIVISSRIKKFDFPWSSLESIHVTHDGDVSDPELTLVLVPTDRELPIIAIDMTEARSSVRARSYLIKSLEQLIPGRIKYGAHSALQTAERKILNY